MKTTTSNENERNEADNVISLNQFRKKKELAQELGQGRKPLYLNQTNGTLSGSPEASRKSAPTTEGQESHGSGSDFGDRLQRIRTSLDRINALMTELRSLSKGNKGSDQKS